ncbi:MAG: hypothetical protein ACM3KI_11175 [Bacillota bacterium]
MPRNRRYYGGTFIDSRTETGTRQLNVPDKAIIEFNTDTPRIDTYEPYLETYGKYPTVRLYTYDELNNRIERPEKPYFLMYLKIYDDATTELLISAIEFGTLSDGVQQGFITISRY